MEEKKLRLLIIFLTGVLFFNEANSMDDKRFWNIIEESKDSRPVNYVDAEYIKNAIFTLTAEEMGAFFVEYSKKKSRLNVNNVYALGCVLNGNILSDDEFLYFRSWFLLQGHLAFKLSIEDPDSIAENEVLIRQLSREIEYEEFHYFIVDAYREKYNKDIYDQVEFIGAKKITITDDITDDISYEDAKKKLPKVTGWLKKTKISE